MEPACSWWCLRCSLGYRGRCCHTRGSHHRRSRLPGERGPQQQPRSTGQHLSGHWSRRCVEERGGWWGLCCRAETTLGRGWTLVFCCLWEVCWASAASGVAGACGSRFHGAELGRVGECSCVCAGGWISGLITRRSKLAPGRGLSTGPLGFVALSLYHPHLLTLHRGGAGREGGRGGNDSRGGRGGQNS